MTESAGFQFPFAQNITALLSSLKLPAAPDADALAVAHQRNIEAIAKARDATLRCGQEIAAQYAEILRQTMTDLTQTAEALAKAETPQAVVAKQMDYLRATFEKTMANMTALSTSIQRANTDAMEALNKRFAEAMEETKAITTNGAGKDGG
jgi:phasin family protein